MLDPQDEQFDRRLATHLVSLYHQSKEDEENVYMVSESLAIVYRMHPKDGICSCLDFLHQVLYQVGVCSVQKLSHLRFEKLFLIKTVPPQLHLEKRSCCFSNPVPYFAPTTVQLCLHTVSGHNYG